MQKNGSKRQFFYKLSLSGGNFIIYDNRKENLYSILFIVQIRGLTSEHTLFGLKHSYKPVS